MVTKKPKTVLCRRRRESRTNYTYRLKSLLAGKPRLLVRLTNKKIIAQIALFNQKGDEVPITVNSSMLKEQGWNYSYKNLSAAYLLGLVIAKKAKQKGFNEAILDTGSKKPLKKGKIYAFLQGVIDGGLNVPYGSDEIFPDEKRIKGEHVKEYALKLKENKSLYELRFANYLKNKSVPENMTEMFEKIKEKIIGSN